MQWSVCNCNCTIVLVYYNTGCTASTAPLSAHRLLWCYSLFLLVCCFGHSWLQKLDMAEVGLHLLQVPQVTFLHPQAWRKPAVINQSAWTTTCCQVMENQTFKTHLLLLFHSFVSGWMKKQPCEHNTRHITTAQWGLQWSWVHGNEFKAVNSQELSLLMQGRCV